MLFERLDPSRHDRESFSCGEASLDAYLKRQASQDVRRRLAACYVLCNPGSSEIIGYYTLSTFAIEPGNLPDAIAATLPRYPLLPAILLGRLAVASAYQHGQRVGQRLLVDAIDRASASEIPALALVVDALDERAASFYEHFGFTPFVDRPMRLYLLLGNLRAKS